MNLVQAFHVFKELLKVDLKAFSEVFWGKLIDAIIYTSCMVLVNGYILSKMGLGMNYGSFFLVGMAASAAFFEGTYNIYLLISDLEGDRMISYDLTLPIKPWLILIKKAVSYALNSVAMSVLILPIGKLLLWNQFVLSGISIYKLLIMFVTINIFFGFFLFIDC